MDRAAWLAAREAELRQRRVEPALPSVPLQAFVGVYEDSTYGEVELQMAGDHLDG